MVNGDALRLFNEIYQATKLPGENFRPPKRFFLGSGAN
jgi:hypothetical protein